MKIESINSGNIMYNITCNTISLRSNLVINGNSISNSNRNILVIVLVI